MLTKLKSTIIKQRGIRKAAKQEAGGGGGLVHLPPTQLYHPLIQPSLLSQERHPLSHTAPC